MQKLIKSGAVKQLLEKKAGFDDILAEKPFVSEIVYKSFIVSRHAKSADNAKGVVSGGQSNPELVDEGIEQAKSMRPVFALIAAEVGNIHISGLTRTIQTGIHGTGRDPSAFIVNNNLRERDLGDLDGIATQEYQAGGGVMPGEERTSVHKARTVQAMNEILNGATDNKKPFVIAHAGTIRRLLSACFGIDAKPDVKNAEPLEFIAVQAAEIGGVKMNAHWIVNKLSVENGKLVRTDITPSINAVLEVKK